MLRIVGVDDDVVEGHRQGEAGSDLRDLAFAPAPAADRLVEPLEEAQELAGIVVTAPKRKRCEQRLRAHAAHARSGKRIKRLEQQVVVAEASTQALQRCVVLAAREYPTLQRLLGVSRSALQQCFKGATDETKAKMCVHLGMAAAAVTRARISRGAMFIGEAQRFDRTP